MEFRAADLIMIEVNNGTSATYELLIVFIGKSVAATALTHLWYQIQFISLTRSLFVLFLFFNKLERFIAFVKASVCGQG